MTLKQRVNDLKYTWEIYKTRHPVLAVIDIAIAVVLVVSAIIYIA